MTVNKNKPYPKYKPSGIDWLGDVPEHWEMKRARFMISMNPTKSEIAQLPTETEVSFLPMESVGDNGSLNLETTRPISEVSSGYTYFAEGDVTFAKITPCFENGKGAIMKNLYNGFGFGTTELTVLRVSSKVNHEYLYYLTISREFRQNGEAWMYGAGGQKRVPDDFVKEFRFCWPSLPEQQAIANFLNNETNRIDKLIEKKRELIGLLKEKRTSLISNAVTKGLNPKAKLKPSGVDWLGDVPEEWGLKRLKYVFRLLTEKSTEHTNPIALENIESWTGRLIETETEFEGEGITFIKDDILFGKLRPYLAKVLKATDSGEAVGDFFVMRPQNIINPDYAAYVLRSEDFIDIVNGSTFGSKMPRVSWDFMGILKLPLPPLPEQQEIANFLDCETGKIDALIEKVEIAIEKLMEYRSAIISAAVTGKIDVRKDEEKKYSIPEHSSIESVLAAKKNLEERFVASDLVQMASLRKRMEEALMPYKRMQEEMNRQMRQITLPSKRIQEYISSIAVSYKRLLDEHFYNVIKQQESFHNSWKKHLEQEFRFEKIFSESIKLKLHTESIFAKNHVADIINSLNSEISQKKHLNNYFESYTNLCNSFKTINDVTKLPDFILPQSNRENLFINYSLAHLEQKEIIADTENKKFIESECEIVKCEMAGLPKEFSDIANMLAGAKEALIGNNPDKIRHALVSLREAFTHVLHRVTPDNLILPWILNQKNANGYLHDNKPTRKARLLYICRNISHEPLTKFFEKDIEAALELINLFQRVHEATSSLSISQLKAIIVKTESALLFVIKVHCEKI